MLKPIQPLKFAIKRLRKLKNSRDINSDLKKNAPIHLDNVLLGDIKRIHLISPKNEKYLCNRRLIQKHVCSEKIEFLNQVSKNLMLVLPVSREPIELT